MFKDEVDITCHNCGYKKFEKVQSIKGYFFARCPDCGADRIETDIVAMGFKNIYARLIIDIYLKVKSL